MKITDIKIGFISVPLKTPFKTALRTVNSVNDIIVKIITDTGHIGYGEAAPTGVITGDTGGAIIGAIEDHIRPAITGLDIENLEKIMLTCMDQSSKTPVPKLQLILPSTTCSVSFTGLLYINSLAAMEKKSQLISQSV